MNLDKISKFWQFPLRHPLTCMFVVLNKIYMNI